QPDPADRDAADRLADLRLAAERRGVGGDRAALGGEIPADGDAVELGELAVEARRQLALLPVRVERRERVLPLPDDDRPGEREDARRRQDGAGDSRSTTHSAV